MSKGFLEISVIALSDEEAEAVAETLRLFAFGEEGVAIEQLGDPDNLDAKAMLKEQKVSLFVDQGRDSAELRQKISKSLPNAQFNILDPLDWTIAWRENYKPLQIGERFLILPSWEDVPPNSENRHIIKLDPGMAFGSGTHPTTQLCMMALEKIVKPNDSVFDVGCGSGILSIASAMLGAGQILAVDVDEDATKEGGVSAENIATNLPHHSITLKKGSLGRADGNQFDIVVANILAVILLDLLDEGLFSHLKPDAHLILSGILDQQTEQMVSKIESVGGIVERIEQLEEWVVLICKKKA